MAATRDRRRADPLLDDLDASQRGAVTSTAAPLAILAGAGSGKTRVLTRRIAWQVREGRSDPAHVLAVTFTRRAAGELNGRLDALGVPDRVTAGTFHAIALTLLRNRAYDRGETPPVLLDRKSRLVAPILQRLADHPVGDRPGAEHLTGRAAVREHAVAMARDVASEIEWAKSRLVPPDSYPRAAAGGRRLPALGVAAVADVYRRYEEEKRRRGLVDFDDLILRCARLTATDEEFAAVTRWRFRHVFVDEFQDVTPAQLRLVRAWAPEGRDLCVVGDGSQSIYGFAGAEPGALERFGELFPDATTVRLTVSYRSTPQIVAASRAVLDAGAGAGAAVRTRMPDGPPPRVVSYRDDAAEAAGVAAHLRDAHRRGTPWSSMAVLYRTHALAHSLEAALGSAGVPVRIHGASSFLDQDPVRAAIGELSAAERRAPGRSFAALLVDLQGDRDRDPEHDPDADGGTTGDRAELVRLGREYMSAGGGDATVDGFVAFLAASRRGGETDGRGGHDAVSLLTFHASKGLEFDVVHVTGVEHGLVPISLAVTDGEVEEERRLLYVALSRAGRELHVSWARERALGPVTRPRGPSPWIAPIEEAVRASARPPADAGRAVRRLRRATRDALAPPPPSFGAADPDLYAALCRWRTTRARAAGVSAHAIFADAVLDAVTTRRPRTEDELREIPGVGPLRAARHGPELLGIVAGHDAPAVGPTARR